MNKNQARHEIVEHFGGEPMGHDVWQFRSTLNADRAKAILDTFNPGFTGEVFGMARLMVAAVPDGDLHAPATGSVTLVLDRHDADALREYVDDEIDEVGLPEDDAFGLHALRAAMESASVTR